MVPFRIRGPNGREFPVTGVVDSGADVSLFPTDWAGPLGIEISACQRIEGGSAGGTGEYHIWNTPLYATLMDRTIELYAIFGSNSEPLLGREDFFAKFEVTIDQESTRFFLTPYDDQD